MRLGGPRRAQGRADQRFLKVEGFVEIGARLSERRQSAVESQQVLLLKDRHRQSILEDRSLAAAGYWRRSRRLRQTARMVADIGTGATVAGTGCFGRAGQRCGDEQGRQQPRQPPIHKPMPCGAARTAQRSTKPPISTSTDASTAAVRVPPTSRGRQWIASGSNKPTMMTIANRISVGVAK